ncbi:MAG: sugar-binding protein [Spirochaetota bacterium]
MQTTSLVNINLVFTAALLLLVAHTWAAPEAAQDLKLSARVLTTVTPPFLNSDKKPDAIVQNQGEFTGGRFLFGEKSLAIDADGKISLKSQSSRAQFSMTYTANTAFGYLQLHQFKDVQIKPFASEKKVAITAKFPLDKPGLILGDVKIDITLLPDGLIRFDAERQIPEGSEKLLVAGFIGITAPSTSIMSGMFFNVDGKDFPLSKYEKNTILCDTNKFTSLAMFADSKIPAFTVNSLYPGVLLASGDSAGILVRIKPDSAGKESFTLDLRAGVEIKQSDAYAGIDIKAADDLNTPVWRAGINLMQNASFEAGFRYWKINGYWPTDSKGLKIFEIDNTVSKYGKNSMLIRHFTQQYPLREQMLYSFTFPVNKRKIYSVSYWAKTDSKDSPVLNINIQSWIPLWGERVNERRFFNIKVNSREWTRYSTNFSFAPEAPGGTAAALTLSVSGTPGGKTWVDGIQVIEGEQSDFQSEPSAELMVNGQPDANVESQSPFESELIIHDAPKKMNGTVQVAVDNFQKVLQSKSTFEFQTDENGKAKIKLPWKTKDFLKGINIVRTEFSGSGLSYTDYFRINIMDYLTGTHKNKEFFSLYIQETVSKAPDRTNFLNFVKYFGIGAIDGGNAKTTREFPKEDYFDHITNYGLHFEQGLMMETVYIKPFKLILSDGSTNEIVLLETATNCSPELERQIETITERLVRSMHWIDAWALIGELDCRFANMPIADAANMLHAFWRGVKKGNPNARVYLDQGIASLTPDRTIPYLKRLIQAVGKTPQFDAIAAHTYRTGPENPDLDDDTAILLKMLDENGYGDTDVFFNEGIWYAGYNIPAWNLNPYAGGTTAVHWKNMPAVSYDMGWGEKISSAFIMRSHLAAMKYKKRIKAVTSGSLHHLSMTLDHYYSPNAQFRVINTLGNMLGDADFREDIRFARDSRAYVFETANSEPVAAVWSYIPDVDRGRAPEPEFDADFGDIPVKFYDMMGARREIKKNETGSVTIPLSPFPVFIKGEPGSLGKISAALKKAVAKGVEMSPFTVSSALTADNNLQITFKNMFSKDWKGVVNIGGKSCELSVSLLGAERIQAPLKQQPLFDRIIDLHVPVSLQENNGQAFQENISLTALKVKKARTSLVIDGDLDDWQNIPEVQITKANRADAVKPNEKARYPGDFQAFFKVAWDENNFYLCSKVVDDKFSVDEKHPIDSRYKNDCLQVYFDTRCDARANFSKTKSPRMDVNDYSYDFSPDLEGNKLTAYLRNVPDFQLSGIAGGNMVEPEIKTAFKRTADGYIYEIAFPQNRIKPMSLTAGVNIGLGLMWSDSDEGLKAQYSIVPGVQCYINANLWPVMVLTEKK